MAQDKVVFEIIATAKGVKVVQQQTDKLARSVDNADKSTKKLTKTRDTYNRKEKGAAQISSNQTKNFSKMQQGIDGGGGSGGLVRAYALLAANVFALTAAFGVLSRSAQIDTLTQSMEVLSTTGGTYVKSLAKNMQEASGFAIDLAQSFRQVSLAASAGLNTSEIEGLTKVAKGAAISLGRNLPDAMDRIFRGAIKLEPEILDEIGLFIRVDEAAQKYARNNGKVTSSLTQVEKRQAFLNEILEQGTRKFAEYAEEIKPDPYVRLGAALGDIAQGGLSLLNGVLGPLLNILADSKGLLTAVFGVLVFSLLKKAIPAMRQFNTQIAKNAAEAADNAREYTAGLKASTTAEVQETNRKLAEKGKLLEADRKLTGKGKGRTGQSAAAISANKLLKVEMDGQKRLNALKIKEKELEKQILNSGKKQQALLKQDLADMQVELRNLEAQERLTNKIANNEARGRIDPKKGSLSKRRQEKLDERATSTTILAGASNKAEQQGMRAGFKELNEGLKTNTEKLGTGSKAMTRFSGTVSILGTGMSRLMMMLGPVLMGISLLSPIIFKLAKALGIGSVATKAFDTSLKNVNDQFENLGKRFNSQIKGMQSLTFSFRQTLVASIAFNKNQVETIDTVLGLEKSFTEWQAVATPFQKWWEGTKNWFGFGREASKDAAILEGSKASMLALALAGDTSLVSMYTVAGVETGKFMEQVKNQTIATNNLAQAEKEHKDVLNTLSPAIQAQLADAIKFGIENDKNSGYTFDRINKLGKEGSALVKIAKLRRIEGVAIIETNKAVDTSNLNSETGLAVMKKQAPFLKARSEAMQNLQSAIKGGEESIGKFNQAMMPKTKVDEILGSFTSIQAKIDELTLIDPDKVNGYFEGFADVDNPLAPLFTSMFEDKTIIKNGTEEIIRVLKEGFGAPEIKDALKTVQKEFDGYRLTIIKAKTELKLLKDQEKQFSKIAAAGEGVNKLQQNLITKQSEKRLEIAQKLTDITVRNAGFGRKEFAEKIKSFNLLTTEKDEEDWLTKNKITRVQMLALQNQLMDEANITRETAILQETEVDRVKKQYNTELLKQLDLELKVTEAKRSNLGLQLQLSSALRGAKPRDVDNATQTIKAAKEKFDYEVSAIDMKKKILEAEEGILLARTRVLLMELGMVKKDPETGENTTILTAQAQTWLDALGKGFAAKSGALDAGLKSAALTFGLATANAIGTSFKPGSGSGILGAIQGAATGVASTDKDGMIDSGRVDGEGNAIMVQGLNNQTAAVQVLRSSYQELAETMGQFGPAGTIVAGVAQASLTLMTGIDNQVAGNNAIQAALKDTSNGFEENDVALAKSAGTAQMAGTVLSGIGQAMAANSKGQIQEVDQQIAAEKRRDGKSKESLAKIAQMEKKKEAMQKKAFEQNKKVQMAVTIANTAASIMAALSAPPIGLGPTAGMPMAIMAGAMGALQLAVIAKTKYQGGASSVQQPSAQKMSVGTRNNSVDVSRGGSAGELSYIRGERGAGSGANNFTASGGAMGKKGYASGGEGILVGERGPELVVPSQKVDVIPNDRLSGGAQNINFSINAVDAAGVEDLLINQRGNIIRMIREAANDTGERFLETVDTQTYGSNT